MKKEKRPREKPSPLIDKREVKYFSPKEIFIEDMS